MKAEVFCNGMEEQPLEQELKISDAFIEKCGKISLEVVVRVINVNYDKGAEILKRCQTLAEYSKFIHMIRVRWKETDNLETAIRETIEICIKQGILRQFLKRNGGDIVSFLYEELSREECESIREEDGYERGKIEGKQEEQLKIAAIMKDKGFPVSQIQEITGLAKEIIEKIK